MVVAVPASFAFVPVQQHGHSVRSVPASFVRRSRTAVVVKAGGFEWDDPDAETFDQGVDNPFKNADLMKGKEGEENMKIDPARLLGPRLNGSNLYLVGMMGSGKTAVGNIVAKRKLLKFFDCNGFIMLLFI